MSMDRLKAKLSANIGMDHHISIHKLAGLASHTLLNTLAFIYKASSYFGSLALITPEAKLKLI